MKLVLGDYMKKYYLMGRDGSFGREGCKFGESDFTGEQNE